MSDVYGPFDLKQMIWWTEDCERHIALMLYEQFCNEEGVTTPEFKKYVLEKFKLEDEKKLQKIRLVIIGLLEECASIQHELVGPLEDEKFLWDHVALLNNMGQVDACDFWDAIPNKYNLSKDAQMYLLLVVLQDPKYECSAEQQLLNKICGRKFLPERDNILLDEESD